MKLHKDGKHVKTIPQYLEETANTIDFIETKTKRLTNKERFTLELHYHIRNAGKSVMDYVSDKKFSHCIIENLKYPEKTERLVALFGNTRVIIPFRLVGLLDYAPEVIKSLS